MTRLPNDCFALPPGVEWIDMEDALAHLRRGLSPITDIDTVAIANAAERVLAQAPNAMRDHPAVDNSAVDGFAFAHPGDMPGDREITLALVAGRSAAGAPWRGDLAPGQAVRILTGAAMPNGADTVALQEDAVIGEGEVRLFSPRRAGANRRKRGENIRAGAPLLEAGMRLSPAALAHLVAGGVTEARVFRRLRVAVLSTGDELAEGAAPEPDAVESDAVIDSNRPMLLALARRLGVETVDLGQAGDTVEAVAAALDRGATEADAILTSGGASGGEEDHVARALAEAASTSPEAAAYHQWRIAIKPGRPLALGLWNGAPVFGLPGNPVAAFVCFLLFARPALRRLGGEAWPTPRGYLVEAGFDYAKKPGRREFLRARLGADGRLEKFHSEGSGLIGGLVWSDGLIDLPHDAGPFIAGARVRFVPFSELGAAP